MPRCLDASFIFHFSQVYWPLLVSPPDNELVYHISSRRTVTFDFASSYDLYVGSLQHGRPV